MCIAPLDGVYYLGGVAWGKFSRIATSVREKPAPVCSPRREAVAVQPRALAWFEQADQVIVGLRSLGLLHTLIVRDPLGMPILKLMNT
jgi:hypothetical protein